MILRIGTRGSALALWQARHIASLIEERHANVKVELTIIKTQGDKILDTPLARIGSKGLFTKEIEEALIAESVDLAVHSMKDLPTELPAGLKLAAVVKRIDPRDVFLSSNGRKLEDIEPGESIGTSSLRRRAFILSRYPDLDIVSIRGNVDTRIKKIQTEKLAGIILAAAGVTRMGFADKITEYIDPDFVIPAIGQGALAIETREDDAVSQELIDDLNDNKTAVCIHIERAFLRRMGGGCQVPMAAHCVPLNGGVKIVAAVAHPDGSAIVRDSLISERSDQNLGVELADKLIDQGADVILKDVFTQDWVPSLCD